jgi:anti-sigma regulatory factor (Ser/Thr protein kinase)
MQKLSIENNIKNLDKIAEFIEQFCTEYNLESKICFDLNLVLDGLVTNTIQYGYNDKKVHWIDILIERRSGDIFIQITDDGIEFNPLTKEKPDINKTLKEKKVGGLGIHFVKQKVNELNYKRENGRNTLTLVKNI